MKRHPLIELDMKRYCRAHGYFLTHRAGQRNRRWLLINRDGVKQKYASLAEVAKAVGFVRLKHKRVEYTETRA